MNKKNPKNRNKNTNLIISCQDRSLPPGTEHIYLNSEKRTELAEDADVDYDQDKDGDKEDGDADYDGEEDDDGTKHIYLNSKAVRKQ